MAVCALINTWWWTEQLSKTCRVLFQKWIWKISASSWFYYKNLSRCTVTWTSNLIAFSVPHLPAIHMRPFCSFQRWACDALNKKYFNLIEHWPWGLSWSFLNFLRWNTWLLCLCHNGTQWQQFLFPSPNLSSTFTFITEILLLFSFYLQSLHEGNK